jgi:hypothetical protein
VCGSMLTNREIRVRFGRTKWSSEGSWLEVVREKMDMVVHTYNPSTQEAEAGGSHSWGQTVKPYLKKANLLNKQEVVRDRHKGCPCPWWREEGKQERVSQIK